MWGLDPCARIWPGGSGELPVRPVSVRIHHFAFQCTHFPHDRSSLFVLALVRIECLLERVHIRCALHSIRDSAANQAGPSQFSAPRTEQLCVPTWYRLSSPEATPGRFSIINEWCVYSKEIVCTSLLACEEGSASLPCRQPQISGRCDRRLVCFETFCNLLNYRCCLAHRRDRKGCCKLKKCSLNIFIALVRPSRIFDSTSTSYKGIPSVQHVSHNSWLLLRMARRSMRREESLMMGSRWHRTVEISLVDSAIALAITLSLCLFCRAEGRTGARAFGSLRFATSVLSLLSHDNLVFKAASSFIVTLLTLGL